MTTPTTHPPDPTRAALLARAALGDVSAFGHATWSAYDNAWARVIAVRSALLAPPQRASDVTLLVAHMLMSDVPSANRARAAARLAARMTAPDELTDRQRAAVLTTIARRPDAAAALIESLAPRWGELAADERHMLLTAAAQDAQPARQALVALSPSVLPCEGEQGGALDADTRRALITAVARSSRESAIVIESLAPHWDDLTDDERQTLLAAATQDARPARQALVALSPSVPPLRGERGGALDADARRALITAVVRSSWESAALIAAWAPRWGELAADERQTLLAAAAREANAARRALVALHGALDAAQRRALLQAVVCHPEAIADLFPSIAPRWGELAADERHMLIDAAARDEGSAQRAIETLFRALDAAQRRALLHTLAFYPSVGAAVIESLAPHWGDLTADERQTLLAAAAREAGAARQALVALHGALDADARRALLTAVGRSLQASADLIDAWAPRWGELAADERQTLLAAAAQQAWSAQRALVALHGALDAAQRRALLQAVAGHPWESAAVIESLAPHWGELAADERQTLLAAAARDADAAQRALVALHGALDADARRALITEVARSSRESAIVIESLAPHWDDLTDDERQTLLDAAAREADAARRALVALHSALDAAPRRMLLTAVARDAWENAALIESLAPRWRDLADDERRMLLDAAARDADAAQRALVALDETLTADQRSALLRAIIPAHDVLAALPTLTVHADDIAAWLPPPDAAVDESERAAWHAALCAGLLPLRIIAVVALRFGGMGPSRATCDARAHRWR